MSELHPQAPAGAPGGTGGQWVIKDGKRETSGQLDVTGESLPAAGDWADGRTMGATEIGEGDRVWLDGDDRGIVTKNSWRDKQVLVDTSSGYSTVLDEDADVYAVDQPYADFEERTGAKVTDANMIHHPVTFDDGGEFTPIGDEPHKGYAKWMSFKDADGENFDATAQAGAVQDSDGNWWAVNQVRTSDGDELLGGNVSGVIHDSEDDALDESRRWLEDYDLTEAYDFARG